MRRGVLSRAASLLRVLRRDPGEFAERLGAIVEGRVEPFRGGRPTYEARTWGEVVAALPPAIRVGTESALLEQRLADIETAVAERAACLGAGAIDSRHDADPLLARCCYACVRWLRPAVVVETGVAHGVTTAYILAALDLNGHGTLHSVDLPPHEDGAADGVAAVVPEELRTRWQLHRGMAQRVLPTLLQELERVDLFVHDSLHTYRNMRMEFTSVWSRLPRSGIILADDIEGNAAFLELRKLQPQHWAVVRQANKPALFGMVIR
jgi:predicted O-methyltransferase YrrM